MQGLSTSAVSVCLSVAWSQTSQLSIPCCTDSQRKCGQHAKDNHDTCEANISSKSSSLLEWERGRIEKGKKEGREHWKLSSLHSSFVSLSQLRTRTQTWGHSGQIHALALVALKSHVLIAFGAKSQLIAVEHDALWVYSVPKYNVLCVSPKLITLYFWFLT